MATKSGQSAERRAEEAWTAINAVEQGRPGWITFEWEQVRVEVMETLGCKEEAQAFRWSCFERTLNDAHLRNYLKRLPEFEDIEAEQRAMATALGFPEIHGPRWKRPSHSSWGAPRS
jgi:hypothetical protein